MSDVSAGPFGVATSSPSSAAPPTTSSAAPTESSEEDEGDDDEDEDDDDDDDEASDSKFRLLNFLIVFFQQDHTLTHSLRHHLKQKFGRNKILVKM